MVNSFVWDGSDLFNGSVAVVEAAIAELFLKFLHLMSLPTDDYRAVKDFVDDQCRGPSIKEKDHLAGLQTSSICGAFGDVFSCKHQLIWQKHSTT